MKNRFFGVTSLMLILAACGLGMYSVATASLYAAAVYAVILAGGGSAIIGLYCAKCPCRLENCGHVFPGLLTKVFPVRAQGKYSGIEYGAVGLSLALMLSVPQIWLWENTTLLVLFWVFVAVALAEIQLRVCPACGNEYCPGSRNKGA